MDAKKNMKHIRISTVKYLLSSAVNAIGFANRVGAQLRIFLRAETACVKGVTVNSKQNSVCSFNLDAASLKQERVSPAAASRTPSEGVLDNQFAYCNLV